MAIIGGIFIAVNFFIQFFTQRHFAKKDERQQNFATEIEELKEAVKSIKQEVSSIGNTTKVMLYDRLAQKIEYILTKDYATPEERHELQMLFEEYKAKGFNGDMDARMDKVYQLRTDHAPHNKARDE